MNNMKTGDIIKLRHATRDLSLYLNERLKSYLNTLESNFYPSTLLGRYIRTSKNTGAKQHDDNFERISQKYADITQDYPYGFTRTLEAPIDIFSAIPAVYPWIYQKTIIDTRGNAKSVNITTPGKWILTYEGFDPQSFASQLNKREKIIGKELKDYVVHYIIMAEVMNTRLDIQSLLNDLRFKVSVTTFEEYGDLPFVLLESDIKTYLPADETVLEITEISGSDNFEELVDVGKLKNIQDGFLAQVREKLTSIGYDLTAD